jgi:hypothetical protein
MTSRSRRLSVKQPRGQCRLRGLAHRHHAAPVRRGGVGQQRGVRLDAREIGRIEFRLRQAAVEAHRHALPGGQQQQHRRTLADAHVAVAGRAVGGVGHLVGALVAQPQLRALRQLARREPGHVGVEQVEALRHVALRRALGRAAVAAGGRHRLDAPGGAHREHGAEGDGHHALHRLQVAVARCAVPTPDSTSPTTAAASAASVGWMRQRLMRVGTEEKAKREIRARVNTSYEVMTLRRPAHRDNPVA